MTHQGMRERVQEHIPHPGESLCLRLDAPQSSPPGVSLAKLLGQRLNCRAPAPGLDCILSEFEEQPLAPDLACRQPRRAAAGERRGPRLRQILPVGREPCCCAMASAACSVVFGVAFIPTQRPILKGGAPHVATSARRIVSHAQISAVARWNCCSVSSRRV